MKRKLIILLIALLPLSYSYMDMSISKKNINQEIVYVEKGDTIKKIYSKFNFKYGIVDKIFLKINPKLANIKEGMYKFNIGKISKIQLLKGLQEPYIDNITLTIPEGFTQKKLLKRIESLGLAIEEEMLEALNSIDFPFYHEKDNFDGYLYPETYLIPRGTEAKKIAEIILGEFSKQFPPENYNDKKKFYDDIKLASIVEFETGELEHKSKVAGVFKKRLRINMLLQSDATLKYELGRMAYKKELMESESLYNTYKHKGLPPTPICSPSKETIVETINAKEDKYLFFFMDGGKTYYSETHEEHLRKRRSIK
ncbi:endolytic transglycosylase MltG [Streptobacillus felis]|uniref:Endolytic murein transglycosylase n=1 Tax=Streptobacillus felis TaxID=1384509 RepID=A0A7Z0PFE8_9FUSO|nr:endolytic transglycosylase MltG [Streptobacillus felis]NYV28212.1 endolytic transglycosylase MltG [Streptobacillus felis]